MNTVFRLSAGLRPRAPGWPVDRLSRLAGTLEADSGHFALAGLGTSLVLLAALAAALRTDHPAPVAMLGMGVATAVGLALGLVATRTPATVTTALLMLLIGLFADTMFVGAPTVDRKSVV